MTEKPIDGAPKRSLSLADLAATAAVGLTLSAAALYSFGIGYWNAYLNELRFSPGLFPVDFPQLVFYGGRFVSPTLVTVIVVLFVIGLVGGGLAWVIDWILKRSRDPKAAETPPLAWVPPALVRPAGVAATIMGLWVIWLFTQNFTAVQARSAATKQMQKIKDFPCEKPNVSPSVGLALEMDSGEPIRQQGWKLICSERFCGLHDGTNAIVVSLEGVTSMRTELPAGCPPASAGSAAKGN